MLSWKGRAQLSREAGGREEELTRFGDGKERVDRRQRRTRFVRERFVEDHGHPDEGRAKDGGGKKERSESCEREQKKKEREERVSSLWDRNE